MLSYLLTAVLVTSVTAFCSTNPSTLYYKLGDMTVQISSDGPMIFDHNIFDVPVAAARESYEGMYRTFLPTYVAQNVPIFHLADGRKIMIDAGAGDVSGPIFVEAGHLVSNMWASGVSPESIDAILLTHGHSDHVGGLTDPEGRVVFPNAEIYITKDEHEGWMNATFDFPEGQISTDVAESMSALYKKKLAPYLANDRVTFVENGAEPYEGFKYILGAGHSPGHASVQVTSEGEKMVVIGDSWISRPDQLHHPEWRFDYETNSTLAYESRTNLLSSAVVGRHLVLAYHEDFPGVGHVVKVGNDFDWDPYVIRFDTMGVVVTTCVAQ